METEVVLVLTRMMWQTTVLMLLFGPVAVRADEPLDDLLEATFRLTDGEHSGTCFLVTAKEVDATNPRRMMLATAAHVMEQMATNDCEVILRIRNEDGSYARSPFTFPIREQRKALWTRHPDADVAVMEFVLPEGIFAKPIPYGQLAAEARVIDRTVRVGRETWIPCFPAKLEGNEAGWPVVRHGSVASHPLVPVKSTKTILVDYKNFGGDSGAPVAMIVDNRPLVIGVVSGMHRQTDRSTLPFEERTMHTPLGLSIVVQSAYLLETIELLRSRK